MLLLKQQPSRPKSVILLLKQQPNRPKSVLLLLKQQPSRPKLSTSILGNLSIEQNMPN
jgi:hypothetical protein